MRAIFASFLLLVAVSAAFACGKCAPGSAKSCDLPDWGYSYNDPHYLPDQSPCALECFHSTMIPMLEARKSHESAYIRENAECLYRVAKKVSKHDKLCCATKSERKHYSRAANDLVQACDRLREIVHGGSSKAIYEQMREVEETYLRLANLAG